VMSSEPNEKASVLQPTLHTPERIRTSDLWFRRAKSKTAGTNPNRQKAIIRYLWSLNSSTRFLDNWVPRAETAVNLDHAKSPRRWPEALHGLDDDGDREGTSTKCADQLEGRKREEQTAVGVLRL